MNDQKVTPEEALANMRETVWRNYHKLFGPYAMPRDSFSSDVVDPIEPYDLERAGEPDFKVKMRRWLRHYGMHAGKVARRLDIDVRLVIREAQMMRLEAPEVMAGLRETLGQPGPHNHEEIAQQFNITVSDVDQVALEILLEDPAFLKLFGDAA